MANVQLVQYKHGGTVRYGWYFLHRLSIEFGDYLIATFHAVWQEPVNLKTIDVTPYQIEKKHIPIFQNGELLFLLDENIKPIEYNNMIIPLPSRFYPLSSSPKLISYIKSLQINEFSYYKQQYGLIFK